jgi:hypothetical protein
MSTTTVSSRLLYHDAAAVCDCDEVSKADMYDRMTQQSAWRARCTAGNTASERHACLTPCMCVLCRALAMRNAGVRVCVRGAVLPIWGCSRAWADDVAAC